MKKKQISCVFIYTLVACACLPLFASSGIISIPDSASIRQEAAEAWLFAPVSMVADKPSEIHYTKRGQGFQISSELRSSELAVVFAPRGPDYQFPECAPGGWTVYRDVATGKIDRVHIYFQYNPYVYVVLRPDNAPRKPKVQVDMVIYGAYAARGVPIGIDFETALCLSFRSLYNLTIDTIPWNYVKSDSRNYVNNLAMIEKIRRKLPSFEYIEDAAYDENGQPVYISTGEARSDTPGKISVSSSGFTKWVVDGIVAPLTGSGVELATLKKTDPEKTQKGTVLEDLKKDTANVPKQMYANDALQIFRSYDWIRNLSTAVACAERADNSATGTKYLVNADETERKFEPGTLGLDVEVNPFAGVVSAKGAIRNVGFIPQTGYEVNLLRPLLYVLASTEPDLMYLGAVKTNFAGADDNPETWTFHHDVVFLPYFDSMGICRIVVFESGVETSFDDFELRNQGSYVYLCRVKSSSRFTPMPWKSESVAQGETP